MTGFVPSIQISFFVFPFGECGKYITLTGKTNWITRKQLKNCRFTKQTLCDQICTYFVSSLFCSAFTVFVLLAILIIAGCRMAKKYFSTHHISHHSDGVCSSQTKDQAIMFFFIKCSGVADQLLHRGDVLKDNWEWELSLDLNNWESGSLICSNNVCTRQNITGPQPLRFNLGGCWSK